MKIFPTVGISRFRIGVLALIWAILVFDLCEIEVNYLAPRSVRPSDTNLINNPTSYGEALVRLGEQERMPCDVIFIGASNVAHWKDTGLEVWNQYYSSRHAFNFGVDGDTTENVLWRLDHTNLSMLKPKVAVIFVGLNNLGDSSREIALGVKAVSNKARSLFPGVKVLLIGLTPNVRNNEVVLQADKTIQTYADNKTVFYVDLYSKMPRKGSSWKGVGPDGVHFDKDGYAIWAEQMEPMLKQVLAADSVAMTIPSLPR